MENAHITVYDLKIMYWVVYISNSAHFSNVSWGLFSNIKIKLFELVLRLF